MICDPFKWLSDLQLGVEKVTLNHLVLEPFFLNHFLQIHLVVQSRSLLGFVDVTFFFPFSFDDISDITHPTTNTPEIQLSCSEILLSRL